MSDFKFAVRQLLKHPGFTVVAVLTLALGIGANAMVFTWIRTTLLDTIPGAAEAERLAVVAPRHTSSGLGETMSIPDIESLAGERHLFRGITASQMGTVPVRLDTTTEWLWGQTTLANFFDVLGVQPVLGRTFLAGEDRPEATDRVAVISYSLWQRRFQGAADALGRVIEVNQRPVTIVGVAPPGFRGSMGGLTLDLWVPLATESGRSDLKEQFASRGWRALHTIARLADGVSFRQAKLGADLVGQRLSQEFPDTNAETTIEVMRTWEAPWGGPALFLPLLRVLAVVGGLLLLLVIANLANLLLGRAQSRRREMALRLALGASRQRVIRHMLIESLLLSALGGGAGLALAGWGKGLLLALMPESYLPIHFDPRMGGGVLVATLAVTLLTGLLFGLAPAWRASRTTLNETLKAAGRNIVGAGSNSWLSRAFVVGEVGMALALLLGMGLCVRSFANARGMDLGFEPKAVWLAGFHLNPHVGDDESVRSFYRRLQTETGRLPGAESAALSSYVPLGIEGVDSADIVVPGYAPAAGENPIAGRSVVSPGYFRTLRVPLLAGREFTYADDVNTPPVAVVNGAFAEKYFSGRDPLGRTFRVGADEARIVGVAKTGKYRSLSEAASPHLFLCTNQRAERNLTLAVRTSGGSRPIASAIQNLAVSLDPNAPPHAAMWCEEYLEAAFAVPRMAVVVLLALGLVALFLALLGIYAVVSRNVAARIPELGVRIALGATTHRIVRLVLRDGLALAALGIGAGAVVGLGVCRLLSTLLIGTSSADPAVWLLVPTLFACTALAACWLPARRATKVDPIEALRCE